MAEPPKADVTAASLKERLGKVFDEIFAQGRQVGREEGYKVGRAEGARIERERILAMCEGAAPGNEAPSGGPAQDGVTGGAEAAPKTSAAEKATGTLSKIKKVLAAETARATDHLSKIIGEKGRQQLPEHPVVQQAADPGMSVDDRCKAEWDREPGLRAEFATLETYRAFVREREAGTLR